MHQIAVLRYCRDVLKERQKTDSWQGWFWGIRRKIVEYWIARLERDHDPAVAVPALIAEEQRAIRNSHPLLAARTLMSDSLVKIDSLWQVELDGRVRRYVKALVAKQ